MRAAGLAVLVFPVVALAFIHYNASTPDPAAGAGWMNGTGTVRLRGTIDDIPRERPTSKLYEFAVTQRLDDGVWRAQEGHVLVRMPLYDVAEYGDLAEIEGKLDDPPADADFDYAGYLLRREITSVAQYPEMRVIEEDYTDGVRDRLVRLPPAPCSGREAACHRSCARIWRRRAHRTWSRCRGRTSRCSRRW
jgi:hypothetical protein